jgi:hypothetical protein
MNEAYGVKPAPATDPAGLLTRESILGFDDRKYCYVAVPEWGGRVKLRTMMGSERDDFELALLEQKRAGKRTTFETNLKNIRAKLVAYCICDELGARLFADTDVTALGRKSGTALDRVYEAARKLNGMTEEEIEELAKNSESGPTEDSATDSPAS